MGEAGDEPALGLADERPETELVLAQDRAHEAHAPHLLGRARKPQLRKRNPQLRRPAERIDRGGDFPDRVPGIIGEVAVVAEHEVVLDPQRVHVEAEGAAVVVVAVEQHPEVVALRGRVAAPQLARDARGLPIVQPRPDVEGVPVVDHPHLGGLGDRFPLLRVALAEVGEGDRRAPRGVVEATVEDRGAVHPHGDDRRGHQAVGVAQHRGVGGGGDGDLQQGDAQHGYHGGSRRTASPIGCSIPL